MVSTSVIATNSLSLRLLTAHTPCFAHQMTAACAQTDGAAAGCLQGRDLQTLPKRSSRTALSVLRDRTLVPRNPFRSLQETVARGSDTSLQRLVLSAPLKRVCFSKSQGARRHSESGVNWDYVHMHNIHGSEEGTQCPGTE